MPKFPEPPPVEELRRIPPETYALELGVQLARVFVSDGPYRTSWNKFRFYGPTASRFDHQKLNQRGLPHEQERGIMYLASGKESIPTCLAEFFQGTRIIDRESHRPVLAGFELKTSVLLLDLRGEFSTKIGASTAINSGPRPRAQRWAQCFYQAYPTIQGILYASSMFGNQPAIALFERGKQCLPKRPILHRELRDPVLSNAIIRVAQKIGYGVV